MSNHPLDEAWYRCLRCKGVYKLKTLMIRHLRSHDIHRFETDSDVKCMEDWERVSVNGREITKIDLPPAEIQEEDQPVQSNWVVSGVPSVGEDGQTLTVITLNSLSHSTDDCTTTTYVGPFDPIISQTLLKLGDPSSTLEFQLPSVQEEYRCRYCDAPFAESRSRAVHESKVHNEQIDGYPCFLCSKKFPTISSVQDHYRCTHKTTPPVKKAWKYWKDHGGDINDYYVSCNQFLHKEPDAIPTSIIDSTTTSSTLTSSDLLQPRFETYYFNTETGSIAVNNEEIVVEEVIHQPHHQQVDISCNPEEPESESPIVIKKRVRKTNRDSSPSKKQKSTTNKKSPENVPEVPKLPKTSPLRYQRLRCSKCSNVRFRTQWELIVHLGDVHAEYTCEFCPQLFSNKDDMIRHQKTAHSLEIGAGYCCHVCEKIFISPRMVQEHVHLDHPGVRVPSTSVALKWRRA